MLVSTFHRRKVVGKSNAMAISVPNFQLFSANMTATSRASCSYMGLFPEFAPRNTAIDLGDAATVSSSLGNGEDMSNDLFKEAPGMYAILEGKPLF